MKQEKIYDDDDENLQESQSGYNSNSQETEHVNLQF